MAEFTTGVKQKEGSTVYNLYFKVTVTPGAPGKARFKTAIKWMHNDRTSHTASINGGSLTIGASNTTLTDTCTTYTVGEWLDISDIQVPAKTGDAFVMAWKTSIGDATLTGAIPDIGSGGDDGGDTGGGDTGGGDKPKPSKKALAVGNIVIPFVPTDAMKSEIKQTQESIKLAVTKDTLASEISMTSDRIHIKSGRFGWESTYSKMEDDGTLYINSYDKSQQLKLTTGKMHLKRDGYDIGSIGANNFKNQPSNRGVVFDLEPDGTYMAWASKDYASDNAFTVKMLYTRTAFNGFSENAVNFACDVDMNNNSIYRPHFRIDGYRSTTINGSVCLPADSKFSRYYTVYVKNGVIVS